MASYLWPFEYEPYDIQKEFMSAMLETLDTGSCGIFESPTGTGKSLSIICSALPWLIHNRGKSLVQKSEENYVDDVPGWISTFKRKHDEDEIMAMELKQKERRTRVELQRDQRHIFKTKSASKPTKRIRSQLFSDDEFGPEESGDEFDDEFGNDSSEEEIGDAANTRKVFFCSRTHSQLSQFMNEIARTPFSRSVACLALGSRSQLCINPKLKDSGSPTIINDGCLELFDKAKQSSKQSKRLQGQNMSLRRSVCPFYDKSSISKLQDHILYESQDIETIAALGEKMHTCPYYGSRMSVHDAEFVALPYSMLLHKETRDSLGISLKGNIVIFDEAHNLIEAVNSVHGSLVTFSNLVRVHSELLEYRKRYKARLGPKNRIGLNNLVVFVNGLFTFLNQLPRNSSDVNTLSSSRLVIQAKIDHINIYELIAYIEESKLTKKLQGFAGKYIENVEIHKMTDRKASSLQDILGFFKAMTNTACDGKILISFNDGEPFLKFLNHNPETYFQDIVKECHAIVLAGGTMQPTEDVVMQLFRAVPESRLRFFSCGHVIPNENMSCFTLGVGPTKQSLEFNFAFRNLNSVIDEAGRCVLNICTVVPHGVVLFLPSYKYENDVYRRWEETGLLSKLVNKKRLFREVKGATDTESILAEYGRACISGGAVLISVVGGKLSEGINFKDELARCVVMIGLPFPNPNDPEMKAKLQYLETRNQNKNAYCENQCMKAVNQCIGRAIRHKGDYASIVLIDARYSSPRIKNKLPKWISTNLHESSSFPQFFRALVSFVKNKK